MQNQLSAQTGNGSLSTSIFLFCNCAFSGGDLWFSNRAHFCCPSFFILWVSTVRIGAEADVHSAAPGREQAAWAAEGNLSPGGSHLQCGKSPRKKLKVSVATLKSKTSKLQVHKGINSEFQISNVFKFFKIFLHGAQLVVMNSLRMELGPQLHKCLRTVQEITRQSLKFIKQIFLSLRPTSLIHYVLGIMSSLWFQTMNSSLFSPFPLPLNINFSFSRVTFRMPVADPCSKQRHPSEPQIWASHPSSSLGN